MSLKKSNKFSGQWFKRQILSLRPIFSIIAFIRSHRRRRRLSDRIALVYRPLPRLEPTKWTRRLLKQYAAPCLELHQKNSPQYRHSVPRVAQTLLRLGRGAQRPRSQPSVKT